jgi:hypothetical protein
MERMLEKSPVAGMPKCPIGPIFIKLFNLHEGNHENKKNSVLYVCLLCDQFSFGMFIHHALEDPGAKTGRSACGFA